MLGCVLCVGSMTLAGYFLGENEWVKHNFEKIVIGLVVVTTAPVLFKMFFGKKPDPTLEVGKDIIEEQFSSNDSK